MTALPKPDPDANDLAACRRKRPYSQRESALRVYEVKRDQGLAVKAYKCPCCRFWHLTKMGAGK